LERIPRFGEKKLDHSALALSRFLAKNPQILGNLEAPAGLRACLRKGKWRRKGNCESECLWALLSNIFNILYSTTPFQDAADLVLGGMVLERRAANIADQIFGWHTDGWDGGFLAQPSLSLGFR
jgi:hypothetical protein